MQANKSLKHAKRIVVGVFGLTILVIGLVMLVMPGPGLIIILAGLGLLATEFVWAKKLLEKSKHHYDTTKKAVVDRKNMFKASKEGKVNNYG